MLRHLVSATLRNLSRNRLYAAISIIGLAVGMSASLLAALYIRDELSFDHTVAGYENVYAVANEYRMPGRTPLVAGTMPQQMAGWMQTDIPNLKATRWLNTPLEIKRGDVDLSEDVAWVDADFFDILAYPVIAGDLHNALSTPDSAVLTRAAARSYFGDATPVGQTISIDGHPMRIGAVIADMPANSHITKTRIFASGASAWSLLAVLDAMPFTRGNINTPTRTYVRVSGRAQAEAINKALPDLITRHMGNLGGLSGGVTFGAYLVPLDRLHVFPFSGGYDGTPQGTLTILWALGGIGLLILFAAIINFVNLMTARATRRALEIGVRKSAGAKRRDLIVQFMGEALLYTLLATLCALALAELMLPSINALLLKDMRLDYGHSPALLGGIVLQTLVTALLAGLYPALVLSGIRPVAALKSAARGVASGRLVRQVLVLAQFSILIGLVLASLVILRQTKFILSDASRMDHDMMLTINLETQDRDGPNCADKSFVSQLRTLPGVRGISCTSPNALGFYDNVTVFKAPDGGVLTVNHALIDLSFFSLYGIHPLAGRLFDAAHPGDVLNVKSGENWPTSFPPVVVNESVARAVAGSAANAVGKRLVFQSSSTANSSAEIIGVVPDFALDLTKGSHTIPSFYVLKYAGPYYLSVKLNGRQIPETLAAIDATWKRTGQRGAVQRQFLDDVMQDRYSATIRQGWLMSVLAAIAVLIGFLGLFGLAAFTAEQRTKEIGIRKAMGASTPEILSLLLWQFTKPVLWANLIAWPIAWYFLNQWLEGFSQRIALAPWMFVLSGAAALTVALITVAGHALLVARKNPVLALRYE